MKNGAIIFDLDDCLFDTHGTGQLYDDVHPTLVEFMRRGVRMYLLTAQKGELSQWEKIRQCRLERYFDPESILVVPRPTAKLVAIAELKRRILEKRGLDQGSISKDLIVGDRVNCEILFGNVHGFTTVRIVRKYGKYSRMHPIDVREKPTLTVTSLSELLDL